MQLSAARKYIGRSSRMQLDAVEQGRGSSMVQQDCEKEEQQGAAWQGGRSRMQQVMEEGGKKQVAAGQGGGEQ